MPAHCLPPSLTLLPSGNPAALEGGGRGGGSQVPPTSPRKPVERVQEESGPLLQLLTLS